MSVRLRPIRSTLQCSRTFYSSSAPLQSDKPANGPIAPPKPRTAADLGFGAQNASRTRDLSKFDLSPSSTSRMSLPSMGSMRKGNRSPLISNSASLGSPRRDSDRPQSQGPGGGQRITSDGERQTGRYDGQSSQRTEGQLRQPRNRLPQSQKAQNVGEAEPNKAAEASSTTTDTNFFDYGAGHTKTADNVSPIPTSRRGAPSSIYNPNHFNVEVAGGYGNANPERSAPVRPPTARGDRAGLNARRPDGSRPTLRRTAEPGGAGGNRGPRGPGGQRTGGPRKGGPGGARPRRNQGRGQGSDSGEGERIINEIWGQAPIPPPPEQSVSLQALFGGAGLNFSPSGTGASAKMIGSKQYENIRQLRAKMARSVPALPHPTALGKNAKKSEVALSTFTWALALNPQIDFVAKQRKIKEAGEMLRKFVN